MTALDNTSIINTITSKYESVYGPNLCVYQKFKYLRHAESQGFFKTSPKKLDKLLTKLLTGLTPESEPTEQKIGKYYYISYIDKKEPAQAHVFKLIKDIGKGGFNRVIEAFDIVRGMPCAYKTPIKQLSQEPVDKKIDPTPIDDKKISPDGVEEEEEILKLSKGATKSESVFTPPDLQQTHPSSPYFSYGESKNIKLLKKTIDNDDFFQSLRPLHKGTPYLPFILHLDKVKWEGKTDIVLELADKTLHNYLSYGLPRDMHVRDVWRFATQLLSTLVLFEAMEIVHTDIKPENMVLQDGKLKLIDFDVLVKLPPANSEMYRHFKTPKTRLYVTKAAREKMEAAETNTQAREAWLYRQRVAFAHAFTEIMRITPLVKENEVQQNLPPVVDHQGYTDLDIKKTPKYDKLPTPIKQLIETLLDESVPSIQESITAALDDSVKKAYKKKAFNALRRARPAYYNYNI